jgi:hypothetical protein
MQRPDQQVTAGVCRRSGIVATCLLLLLIALAVPAAAQDARGSIAGRVTDTSGAVLPGASVTVTNVETNVGSNVHTNDNGQYTVLFLLPGTYSVAVELDGFRKSIHPKVPVRVGDKVQLDMVLEPGGVTEEVSVSADRPILESGTATMGQVIDSKLISEIPLGDGTAYGLTRLVAGATFERSYALQRPMDNDNLRGVTVSGSINSEFSIDGTSNVGSQARVAIQPPSDAIQEFKVETAVYDAQVGHTGAGSVNLALKSGTNSIRGAASYYNRDDSRSANLFATNARGGDVSPRNYNRFSATVGGPIIRNKTFFLGSYEKLQDDTIETFTSSVPTERMRNGDFSELLRAGIQIYNPYSARLVNGVVTRDPFPGNIIPQNLLNQVALNTLKYYPLPNQAGNNDTSNNYFVEQPWTYGYDFQMARVDHQFTDSNRSYVRWIRNFRREERYNWAGEINGAQPTRGSTDRFNLNVAAGHTAVIGNTWFVDVKGSFLRFNDDQIPAGTIDPATLGYSQQALSLFRGYQFLPRFNIESGNANATTAGAVAILGGQQNGFNSGRAQPFYNIMFAPTITKTTGSHTIKMGYDWRLLRQKEVNEGWKGGTYSFDSAYTRASAAATGQYGQGIASFMLGLPIATSFIETRALSDYSVNAHGVFIHDDWRVTDKLTLNLGVRYDLELGMTEAENRNVRGFDLTSPSPIQSAAQAAYARVAPNGVPLSAADFGARLVGGYQYLTDQDNRVWDADMNNVQPRMGATYKLNDRTVIRGGAGLFTAPFQIQGVPGFNNVLNQIGFSRNTPVPVTTDNGLTFGANLSNPVPSGQLLEPVGSSLGLSTNLGGNPGTVFSTERFNPDIWRYSVGVERELPWQLVAEVSYLGQTGSNLPIVQPLNYVPQAYRTSSALRDTAAETFLTQTVNNPFQGLFPENPGGNGATIPRRRLLLQYPQFDTLAIEKYEGSNQYHGLLMRLDKRFTSGFMVMTTYTWSHFTEKVAPLNPWEGPEERIGTVDRPHRFTLATVTELPFGNGRKFGNDWNGVLNTILGGWQFATKFEFQTGQPLTFNNNTYFDPSCGDPKDLKSTWGSTDSGQKLGVDIPFFDTSCFYTFNGQPFRNAAGTVLTNTAPEISMGAANIRTFPTTLPHLRFQNHHLLDLGLTKNFQLGSRVRVQVRAEALNFTNYTLFNAGNVTMVPTTASFGTIANIDSSTVMKPRDVQLGVRVTF